jgi:DNA primase
MEPHWLTIAKSLPAGRSTKIECCASDRSMLVENGVRGYRGYCFRCGEAPFEPHGEHSISVIAQRNRELAESRVSAGSLSLPRDFTLDIPPAEATWLYKAGISAELARAYRIGWSDYFQRIVLPVYDGDKLIGYTARSRNGRPKYIEKTQEPSGVVFNSRHDLILPSSVREGYYGTLAAVFTEDILSAVRVGRNVGHACAVLGTSITASQLSSGLAGTQVSTAQGRLPQAVAVWLDGDKAGRVGSRRLRTALALQGYEVVDIRTPKDPKFYTNKEIRSILNDRCGPTAADKVSQ